MAATPSTLDPNLLQTAKKPKGQTVPRAPGSRKKRLLKVAAYVFFFLSALIFFTILKIPDSAVANYLLANANRAAPAYQFRADKIALRFFPLPHLFSEKFAMEPRMPGSAVPFTFDELRVYPNPFALGASFRAEAYSSKLKGSASSNSFYLESDNVDLAKMTPLTEVGLELKGLLTTLYVNLSLNNQRVSSANGRIQLKGKNVVFDAGAFQAQTGMALPVFNLGEVEIEGEANNGQLRIEKCRIGSPGKDLEIRIPTGIISLSDVMMNTRYDLQVHIKPSATTEKAVPAFLILSSIATKRPDGFYSLKIAGNLASVPSITKGN